MLFNSENIFQRYSFEIYPSTVIGTSFKNVKYLGTIDASGVTAFDPQIQHSIVYPFLPSSPERYDSYLYHRFQLDSGEVTFIGDPWIKEASVKALDNVKIVVTYDTGVNADDEKKIRQMNLNNGYDKAKIELIAQ